MSLHIWWRGARLPQRIVLETARETAALFREHWRAEKKNLPLSKAVIDTVEAHVIAIFKKRLVIGALDHVSKRKT